MHTRYSSAIARPSEDRPADRRLSAEEAEQIAQAIGAFATGSRLRLLWAMLDGEHSVAELSAATGLSQATTSQQLRVLRDARVVRVRRDGRHAFYALHDHHLPDLLAAIRHHYEHLDSERRGRAGEGGSRSAGRRTRVS